MKAVFKRFLKRSLQTQSSQQCCRSGHWGREARIVLTPGRSPISLAGAVAAGHWRSEEPGAHICGKEPGSCRAAFSNTVQTRGLSSEETWVSRRIVHGRAHWKCLHLIIKVLKDMALFQKNQKRIHCEIPTLAKISLDISEWSFNDIFTEVCSFLAEKNLTPLFNHVTPHFHWLSLFSFSWIFPWCKYMLQYKQQCSSGFTLEQLNN